jgi:hypothetical protein
MNAAQRYGGIRKSAARRPSRLHSQAASPSWASTQVSSLPTAEATPEPERETFHLKQASQAGIDDPYSGYITDIQQQQQQRLQQLQHLSLDASYHQGIHAQPVSPPSTVASFHSYGSPYTKYSSVSADEEVDFNGQDMPYGQVVLYDRTNCDPGYHTLDCIGPGCPV